MSRPIAESLSLLSETLGNCKTNLKEKEVADVDNIKISDVDEKIAEIKSGGGESDLPKYYTVFPTEYDDCEYGSSSFKISTTQEQLDQFNKDYNKYDYGSLTVHIYAGTSQTTLEAKRIFLFPNKEQTISCNTSINCPPVFFIEVDGDEGYTYFADLFIPKGYCSDY